MAWPLVIEDSFSDRDLQEDIQYEIGIKFSLPEFHGNEWMKLLHIDPTKNDSK